MGGIRNIESFDSDFWIMSYNLDLINEECQTTWKKALLVGSEKNTLKIVTYILKFSPIFFVKTLVKQLVNEMDHLNIQDLWHTSFLPV